MARLGLLEDAVDCARRFLLSVVVEVRGFWQTDRAQVCYAKVSGAPAAMPKRCRSWCFAFSWVSIGVLVSMLVAYGLGALFSAHLKIRESSFTWTFDQHRPIFVVAWRQGCGG